MSTPAWGFSPVGADWPKVWTLPSALYSSFGQPGEVCESDTWGNTGSGPAPLRAEGGPGRWVVGGKGWFPDTIHYNSPQLSANCKLLLVDYHCWANQGWGPQRSKINEAIPFMEGTHRMKVSEGQP